MSVAVIDASVLLARVLDEPRPAWVDEVIDEGVAGHIDIVAPSLIWVEYGNRWARRDTSDERALEALLRVETLGIQVTETERPQRLRALTLAREHRLSMYDAVYLAHAESVDAPLYTLDHRLQDAAERMGLGRQRGGHGRISEPSASYGDRAVDLTSLAAIGAALAEMRSEYSD